MATIYNSCFFCAKLVPQNYNHEHEDLTDSCDSFKDDSIVNGESARKCVLQISNYLQVPKREIVKGTGDHSKISICAACWNVSAKLSNLCGELEVIKMKITYFLNLLSDQISIDNAKSRTHTHQSTLQKSFYQKCVSKLASTKVNPELRVTKCHNPTLQAAQQNSKVLNDDHNDNVNFEGESQSKSTSTIPADIFPLLLKSPQGIPRFRCPECPMILQSQKHLEKHVEAVHRRNKNRSGHKNKACDYCGAMMSTVNLGRHIRNMHGIDFSALKANRKIEKLKASLEGKKRKRCKFCKKLISMKNLSRHEKLCCLSDQVKNDEKSKSTSKTAGNSKKINCSGNKSKLSNSLNPWKCQKCGERFSFKNNLTRHLRQSPTCGRPQFRDRFECSSCSRRFSQLTNLSNHLKRICKTGWVIDYGDRERVDQLGKNNNVTVACIESCSNETGNSTNEYQLLEEQQIKVENGQVDQITGIFPDNCPISSVSNEITDESTTIDIKFEPNVVNSSVNGSYEIVHANTGANNLDQVETESTEGFKLPCGYCEKLVNTKELQCHKRSCRRRTNRLLTFGSKKMTCERCSFTFANMSSLTRHLRQSSAWGFDIGRKNCEFKDRFECSVCHLRFSRRHTINMHLGKYCKNGGIIDHGDGESRQTEKSQTTSNLSVPCEQVGSPSVLANGSIISKSILPD